MKKWEIQEKPRIRGTRSVNIKQPSEIEEKNKSSQL
jgi:hypothetical protein